jgi:hypothetical protein
LESRKLEFGKRREVAIARVRLAISELRWCD